MIMKDIFSIQRTHDYLIWVIYLRKTKCMVIMSINSFAKIVKFTVPEPGVQVLVRGQCGHVVNLY